jgi:hypothetical protein
MVINEGISIVGGLILRDISELNCKVLDIQQLLPLHLLINLYLVALQVLLLLVDALRKDAHRAVGLQSVEANAPQEGASVLDEGDGNAESNEADLLEPGGLEDVFGLLAEGQAVTVQFDQVCQVQEVLDVALNDSPGLHLQQSMVGPNAQTASIVDFNALPSFIGRVRKGQHRFSHL